MKALFFVALVCFSITVNGFFFPTINKKDIQTTRTANGQQFTEYEAVSGIIRGALKVVGIDHPVDSIYCFNKESADAVYSFIQGLSMVSATTGRAHLPNAVGEYLGTVGNRLYEKISEANIKCLADSRDIQKVVKALGVNPGSDEFNLALVNTIVEQPGLFQSSFNIIYQTLSEGDFENAGGMLAGFQNIVANKIKKQKL